MRISATTAFALATALAIATAPGPSHAGEPDAAASAPAPEPITKREARGLLRYPRRGSLSLGRTNGGRLVNGVAMPLKGRAFKVFPSFIKRETNWGTGEMIALIKRAAAAVRKQFAGAVLGIGNISKKEGGQTGYSVSHKSGRDADIAMFARNARGKRVNLMSFIKFGEDGWDSKRRYRFDVQRNLALVAALVGNGSPDAQVQFIFVARWLKRMMLAEADKQKGFDPELRRRIDEVLLMPSDSNPHQDHFHVRIYCSVQDRLYGCLERGPIRDWVDLGDDALAAHAARLALVAKSAWSSLRRQAVARLGEIRAATELPTLMELLNHADARTRSAALTSLERIGDPVAIPGLLYALKQATDAGWAADLVRGLARIGGRTMVDVAVAVLQAPQKQLSTKLAKAVPADVKRAAASILSRFGRESALPPLLALLDDKALELRRLAHRGLLRVTNQVIELKARSTRQLAKAKAKWHTFVKAHGGKPWLEWQRLGLLARGIELPRTLTKKVVPKIIEAIALADDIASDNAVWLLSYLTGNAQDPAWRSKRNNRRHWRSWWRDNASTVPDPLPDN